MKQHTMLVIYTDNKMAHYFEVHCGYERFLYSKTKRFFQ